MPKEQNWPGTWMVFGIFTVLFSFWWVGSKTFITYTALGRWFALFAFAGNLLSYKHAGLRLGMERFEWFMFNLLAVGPFVFSAALWVNVLVTGPEQLYLVHSNAPQLNVRRYWLEHGELPPNTPLDLDGLEKLLQQPQLPALLLGTAEGSLGYRVITRWDALQ